MVIWIVFTDVDSDVGTHPHHTPHAGVRQRVPRGKLLNLLGLSLVHDFRVTAVHKPSPMPASISAPISGAE
jgi:hypothetical protein